MLNFHYAVITVKFSCVMINFNISKSEQFVDSFDEPRLKPGTVKFRLKALSLYNFVRGSGWNFKREGL